MYSVPLRVRLLWTLASGPSPVASVQCHQSIGLGQISSCQVCVPVAGRAGGDCNLARITRGCSAQVVVVGALAPHWTLGTRPSPLASVQCRPVKIIIVYPS